MDKRITLKKPKNKRILKNDIPDLTAEETTLYLQHFFIKNSLLDNSISSSRVSKEVLPTELKKCCSGFPTDDILSPSEITLIS